MTELPQIQNYHPQANPQIFLGIASGSIEKAGVSIVVVPDTTTKADLSSYRWQIPHFKSLPKFESPELSEYLLTQLGIYHATSLVHILDEAVYYPNVKYHIMSILLPSIATTQELDFDMLPMTSTGVIASVVDDEEAHPRVTDVRNTSFFRFLEELEARSDTPDDMKDEE
jgi:hypothetical protein